MGTAGCVSELVEVAIELPVAQAERPGVALALQQQQCRQMQAAHACQLRSGSAQKGAASAAS
jgi:hypothetical protein